MKTRLFVPFLLFIPLVLQAQLEVSPFFGDQMVVQREQPLPVWGKAAPGETVKVTFREKTSTVQTDENGKWQVELPPQSVGEPATLEVQSGDQMVRFQNVLVGEVWICSGQSNMEWPVTRAANGEAEIAAADFPNIRFFQIPNTYSPTPVEKIDAKWLVCSPETVGDFSAVGYYFARELLKKINVPIGLVSADWGGSSAEAWTPLETLKKNPAYEVIVAEYYARTRFFAENPNAAAELQQAYDTFMETVRALTDAPPTPSEEWFDHKEAIANSQMIPANKPFFEETDGLAQVRTVVELTEEQANAHGAVLKVGQIDNYDVAWVNGVEVGRTVQQVADNRVQIRVYPIPDGTLKAGPNVVLLQVIDWFQTAIFGAKIDRMEITWPNGDAIALASEWEMQTVVDLGKRPETLERQVRNTGSLLYNGMIAPIVPAAFRGVIWYQGEGNTAKAEEYRTLFPDLINSWREVWNRGPFPFYFVQLANFNNRDGWPELREAQREALVLPNTGMAVAIDIGDPKDIHPRNKQDVGKRLALWALARTYNVKQADGSPLPHSGPLFREAVVEKGKVRLRFDHSEGGLKSRDGGLLTGFTVAEEGGDFQLAKAQIEGDEVIISHPEMKQPTDVRYAWAINPDGNLTNGTGLPASPFRTDKRPWVTE